MIYFKSKLLLSTNTFFVLAIAMFLYTSQSVLACDVCGCSVGGNYWGILPQFQKSFAGVRYQQRSFQSEHLTLFPGEHPLLTQEIFHVTEVWGRYVPHKRVHLFAFMPYNYFTKDEGNIHSVVSGIGDVSIMTHYIIFNNGEKDSVQWKQALQFGIGVKLPTGKSNNIQAHNGLLIPSLQAGSGSLDFPLNLIYTLRKDKWGANIEANYRINTVNIRGYKFGNRFTSSLRFFYWSDFQGVSLLPHIGMSYEYGYNDLSNNKTKEYTGGNALLANAGLDIYYKRFVFNLSTQIPLYQNIAQGQVTGKQRFNAGLAFLLN